MILHVKHDNIRLLYYWVFEEKKLSDSSETIIESTLFNDLIIPQMELLISFDLLLNDLFRIWEILIEIITFSAVSFAHISSSMT